MYRNISSHFYTQKGSALVIAVFVIVVMTLLGVALVKMIKAESDAIANEVLGTRAFQAAQTGAQRQLKRLFPLLPNAPQCSGETDIDLSNTKGLENCKVVESTCQNTANVDGAAYYKITSTGQCSVGGVLTSRKIEIQARSL